MSLPPASPKGYQLWYYYPSVPGNIAFAAIFGLFSLLHLCGIIVRRKPFCIPLIVGGIFEVVGYVFRVIAHNNPSSTPIYAAQTILILLAPILFAASVYMHLGRIIVNVHGEDLSIINPRILTRVFVYGDVLCFLLQAAGGGISSMAKINHELGPRIILGGLILQIVIFFFFVVVAIHFHIRMAVKGDHSISLPWQRLLYSTYAVSSLITLRNVVRAVEYGMGTSGYLLQHEWVIFAFDGAAMILVLLICLTWYKTRVGSRLHNIDTDSEKHNLAGTGAGKSTVFEGKSWDLHPADRGSVMGFRDRS